jgi:hypothetical protein
MPTLFQQLENNESMLLMYVAGELPAADMAEVEQMLARDAGLRAELTAIQSDQDSVYTGLAELDRTEDRVAGTSGATAQAAAVRQVGRAMRQWKVDRLRPEPVQPARRWMRLPAWTYPAGAVASVLIGSLIFWGMRGGSDQPSPAPSYADKRDFHGEADPAGKPNTKLLAMSLQNDESTPVDDAESQANSLVARSDDASVTNSIFMSENGQ